MKAPYRDCERSAGIRGPAGACEQIRDVAMAVGDFRLHPDPARDRETLAEIRFRRLERCGRPLAPEHAPHQPRGMGVQRRIAVPLAEIERGARGGLRRFQVAAQQVRQTERGPRTSRAAAPACAAKRSPTARSSSVRATSSRPTSAYARPR